MASRNCSKGLEKTVSNINCDCWPFKKMFSFCLLALSNQKYFFCDYFYGAQGGTIPYFPKIVYIFCDQS